MEWTLNKQFLDLWMACITATDFIFYCYLSEEEEKPRYFV